MLEELINFKNKGSLMIMLGAIIAIFLSGIFFGGVYLFMDKFQTGLEGVQCDIPNNIYFDTCQEWFQQTIYKVLNLKEVLVSFSYIFIFSLVIGLLVVGYRSGKSPVLIGFLLVMTILFTYLGIEISNVYRTLLENTVFYDAMINFTVYNKIMLNFPWFIGFIGLFSMALSIVNFQRSKVNTPPEELNY